MTTLSSVYSSLTGLLSFSKALDVLSDNVANLNTIGYKERGYRFESLGTSGESRNRTGALAFEPMAAGTSVYGSLRNLSQGEIQQTSKTTDLAVQGNGFFVIRDSGHLLYTRDGQFELRGDGRLVHASGGILQALTENGRPIDLVIPVTRTSPSLATKRVAFSGQLGTNPSGDQQPYEISGISVVDGDGVVQVYSASFENLSSSGTQGEWRVTINDDSGFPVGSGIIRFQGSGAPQPGFNEFSVQVRTATGRTTPVSLYFGDPGSLDGAVQGGISDLQVSSADGYVAGRVASFQFDESGLLTVEFSNGQSETGSQIAVAAIPVAELVETSDGVLFRSDEAGAVPLGHFGSPGFGALASSSLELGNVDLSREFADIIILQRGFQASSQILNVSSSLIEDVYSNLGRR